METEDKIVQYLIETYNPYSIIIYGSFSNGTNNENSDFDALIITDNINKHDTNIIDDTVLDVFIYLVELFEGNYDPQDFVQVYNGKIILDNKQIGQKLIDDVRYYVDNMPRKTTSEIEDELKWCEKMLNRIGHEDAEGYYRWHLLLVESLEIYCDINGLYYFGSKNVLNTMKSEDKQSYEIYFCALRELDRSHLTEWIRNLSNLYSKKYKKRI